MKLITLMLIAALTLNAFPKVYAQDKPAKPPEVFEKVEVLVVNGKKVKSLPARLRLEGKSLIVEDRKTGDTLKTFDYDTIKFAEYSYSKHPRWKTALGVIGGSAGVVAGFGAISEGAVGAAYGLMAVFPVALLIGLPIAGTKSKRHWLTLRTGNDYVVLRLDKNNRKLVIPAIETRTSLKVEDIGEKK